MLANNNITQVLVPSVVTIAALDSDLTTLAVGALGVYDGRTNLALDASVLSDTFFIAVGLDSTGDGVKDSLRVSTGQNIQARKITGYTFRPHTPGQNQILEIVNTTADCDTQYGFKVTFENQAIYLNQGFVPYSKFYTVKTACCDACSTDCPTEDPNELTILMVDEVNNDSSGFITATYVAAQALTTGTHGVSQNYADGEEMLLVDVREIIDTFNPGEADSTTWVFANVQIELLQLPIETFCSVNPLYKYPRGTVATVTFNEGFACGASLNVVQNAVFPEGEAYDIKQMEYHASGWNEQAGPYVNVVSTGLGKNIVFNAVDGVATVPAISEVSEIVTEPDVAGSLNDTFFLWSSTTVDYYIWINVNAAGTDPAIPAKTGIEIAVATGAADTVIATAIQVAMDLIAGITATVLTRAVTVTADVAGVTTDISDITSTFAVTTLIQGVDAVIGNGFYDQFVLEYDNVSQSNNTEFAGSLSTIIAIPSQDQTLQDALVLILDALIVPHTGLQAQAPAVTAAVALVTTIETTTSKTFDTDGLS